MHKKESEYVLESDCDTDLHLCGHLFVVSPLLGGTSKAFDALERVPLGTPCNGRCRTLVTHSVACASGVSAVYLNSVWDLRMMARV